MSGHTMSAFDADLSLIRCEVGAMGALAVWSNDEAIDAAHAALLRELLTYMMEDPRNIVACAHLLFCSKNLERIGDRTTNIAESVHYLVTGNRLSADRPKGGSRACYGRVSSSAKD